MIPLYHVGLLQEKKNISHVPTLHINYLIKSSQYFYKACIIVSISISQKGKQKLRVVMNKPNDTQLTNDISKI